MKDTLINDKLAEKPETLNRSLTTSIHKDYDDLFKLPNETP